MAFSLWIIAVMAEILGPLAWAGTSIMKHDAYCGNLRLCPSRLDSNRPGK